MKHTTKLQKAWKSDNLEKQQTNKQKNKTKQNKNKEMFQMFTNFFLY